MKLHELVGVKKYSQLSFQELIGQLIDSKKVQTKNGSFAVVFIPKDGDFVYKVWTSDEGWEKYLEYALQHQDNPHILKVKSRVKSIPFFFKRDKDFDTTMKVVKLEKLKPLPVAYHQVFDLLSDSHLAKYKKPQDLRNAMQDQFEEMFHGDTDFSDEDDMHSELPGDVQPIELDLNFYQALIDLSKLFVDYSYENDLHAGNVMLRGETMVLTDPLKGGSYGLTASELASLNVSVTSDKTKSGNSPKKVSADSKPHKRFVQKVKDHNDEMSTRDFKI